MDVLEADAVLSSGFSGDTGFDPLSYAADRTYSELQRLYYEGKLSELVPTADPKAVFALGVVGGVVGSKLLKGTLGVVVGAGLAWWAWSSLPKPAAPVKRKPPEPVRVKTPGALPPLKGN